MGGEMNESTIQRVFTSRDWNESTCDTCCKYTGVVLIGDERACHNCLLTAYDEAGDKVVQDSDLHFGNEPFQRTAVVALLLAIALSGVVLGSVLHEVMKGIL